MVVCFFENDYSNTLKDTYDLFDALEDSIVFLSHETQLKVALFAVIISITTDEEQ